MSILTLPLSPKSTSLGEPPSRLLIYRLGIEFHPFPKRRALALIRRTTQSVNRQIRGCMSPLPSVDLWATACEIGTRKSRVFREIVVAIAARGLRHLSTIAPSARRNGSDGLVARQRIASESGNATRTVSTILNVRSTASTTSIVTANTIVIGTSRMPSGCGYVRDAALD